MFFILILLTAGCNGSTDDQSRSALQSLSFTVTDSLLATQEIIDSTLLLAYRTPVGWKKEESTMLDSIWKRSSTSGSILLRRREDLRAAFADPKSGSLLLVAKTDSAFDSRSLDDVGKQLRLPDSSAQVKSAEFLRDVFHVRQLLITSGSTVTFLFVLHKEGEEENKSIFLFIIPKDNYIHHARTIESVVGAIRPLISHLERSAS